MDRSECGFCGMPAPSAPLGAMTVEVLQIAKVRAVADLLRGECFKTGEEAANALYAAISTAPPPPAEQASGEMLDKPLKVFSDGEWSYAETGQSFSAADLDEAAFVVYRDRLAAIDAIATLSQRPVTDDEMNALRGLIRTWREPEPDNGEEETEFDKGCEQTYRECADALEAYLAPQKPEKGEG